jgi:hypothetical protein
VPAVDELQKPGGVYCSHCAIGQGCKIYSERPDSCRNFLCGWILNPHMGPELKPDRCHVVLSWWEERRALIADCDPDRPEAWRAPGMIDVLRQAVSKLPPDWKVIAAVGPRTWLITRYAILSDSGEATPFAPQALGPRA